MRRAWLVAFGFSAFINALMLSTPLFTLQIFETVVPLGSLETLVIITAAMLVAVLTLALLEIARDTVLLRASVWLDHELGRHLLESGLRLGAPSAELKQDVRALEQLQAFIASPAAGVVMDAPFAPVFLFALFVLNPVLGAVAGTAALFLVLAAYAQTRLTSRLHNESTQAHEKSGRWLRTVLSNPQLAGSMGLLPGASHQWQALNEAHIAAAYSHGKRSNFIKAIVRSVRICALVALYTAGAILVIHHEMAPGTLVASAILLARVLGPLEALTGAMRPVRHALAAYHQLKALREGEVTAQLPSTLKPTQAILSLSDVTHFHQGRKVPALRGISFELPAGTSLGIVGPNGSGKSALISVLAGVLSPTAGSATLDGLAIIKWQRCGPAPPIGLVSDDPVLLDGTVYDNISRFTPMSMMSVAQAAMRAGAHELLQALPAGYDTPVGPQGSALSLRERRAVCFARAVALEPRIIILDEPEAGLDGAGLKRLMSDLARLKQSGVALILATQDPKLLALVDKIAVLSDGALRSFADAAELSRAGRPHVVAMSKDGAGDGMRGAL